MSFIVDKIRADKKWAGSIIHLAVVCIVQCALAASLAFVYLQNPESDLYVHAHILDSGRLQEVSYPLWHYTAAIFYKFFHFSLEYSAVAACVFFQLLFVGILWMFLYFSLKDLYSLWTVDMVSTLLCVIQPLYWENVFPQLHIGRSLTNPYANPTQNTMRPMALVVTILTAAIWNTSENEFFEVKRKKISQKNLYRFLTAVFLLLSVLAKPSFAQIYYFAFVLALAVRFVKAKGKNLKECFYDGCCLIPSCIPFLITYFTYFGNPGSDQSEPLAISFLEVWHIYTDSAALSILAALAFCIAVAGFLGKRIWNYKAVVFSWVMTFIGILEYMFLVERGDRYYHANFSWGYQIGCSLLWIFSFQAFLQELDLRKERKKGRLLIWKVIIAGLVLWHTASGIRDILLDTKIL